MMPGEPRSLKVLSVPEHGLAGRRRMLLEIARRMSPATLLVTAPGGYGKSIFAAQLAQSDLFDQALWLDAGGQDLGASEVLESLAAVLEPTDSTVAAGSLIDVRETVLRILAPLWGQRVCLVVDNLQSTRALRVLSSLSDVIARATGGRGCVVVTTRTEALVLDGSSSPSWIVDANDLRFGREEAVEVLEQLVGGLDRSTQLEPLLDASGGQPALFCMLGRHSTDGVPRDWFHLETPAELACQLALVANTQLSDGERRVLYLAALMGEGTASALVAVGGTSITHELKRVADCIPLVRVGGSATVNTSFSVHDVARQMFSGVEFGDSVGDNCGALLDCAVAALAARDDGESAVSLLLARGENRRLAEWLDCHGEELMRRGSDALLSEALGTIPTSILMHKPRLILLEAALQKRNHKAEDAARKAEVAADLAELEGDVDTELRSKLLLGRLYSRLGDPLAGRDALESVVAKHHSSLSPEAFASVSVSLAVLNAHLGCGARALECLESAKSWSLTCARTDSATRFVRFSESYVLAALYGRHNEAITALVGPRAPEARQAEDCIEFHNQTGMCLLELGRLARAAASCQRGLDVGERSGVHEYDDACLGSLACIRAAQGMHEEAESIMEAATALTAVEESDYWAAVFYRSTWRRAAGDSEGAIDDAERAFEHLNGLTCAPLEWGAALELAASLLSLGDVDSAARRAREIRDRVAPEGALGHTLRADLILAEVARSKGDREGAVATLAQDEDYILSENGNWLIAMYVRAFPGLLGVLAKAIGVDAIPAHLLRMILPENAKRSLPMAREYLDDDVLKRLAVRLVGEEEAARLEAQERGPSRCRVRLFGGLDVVTGDGPVSERAWGKRKARLLFAMMVVRRGQDVPRDQLLDHLWSDMDAERALSNFYVVWNNMKKALCPGLPKGERCPYIASTGGVVRLDDILVTSDLDDFDGALLAARKALEAGDRAAAVDRLMQLPEIYQGDLLPGDVYDDWFAPLRDRCRQDLGDAMLRAAEMLLADDDSARALQAVRAGLTHDPWREDLCQVALRCQIELGQRSAAIDTYMSCMRKLSEDLGIDPSAETRRLYGRVLAMEDSSAGRYGG